MIYHGTKPCQTQILTANPKPIFLHLEGLLPEGEECIIICLGFVAFFCLSIKRCHFLVVKYSVRTSKHTCKCFMRMQCVIQKIMDKKDGIAVFFNSETVFPEILFIRIIYSHRCESHRRKKLDKKQPANFKIETRLTIFSTLNPCRPWLKIHDLFSGLQKKSWFQLQLFVGQKMSPKEWKSSLPAAHNPCKNYL